MDEDIEECIKKKIPWPKLPPPLRRMLSDSPREYEKYIYDFSIRNQLRYRGSLVRTIIKDEKRYYEAIVKSSIQRLMLFPYHLADMIVKGLRITPFLYYVEVVALLIEQEKSYDTLPNFAAADCLRLLGIGRNEYLELVAKSRSHGRRGRSKALRSLLPKVPRNIPMQPWWRVELGYVLENDVKHLSASEKALIDLLIDQGSQTAGTLDYNDVKSLYRRGLIYLEVPITGADRVAVPPLKGFVMNRVAGDYFETLLYKVFVSIDEHTTVADLAAVLQLETELVKQVVSLYCRLGFARNLHPQPASPPHPTWQGARTTHQHAPYSQIDPLTFDPSLDDDVLQMEPVLLKHDQPTTSKQSSDETDSPPSSGVVGKRIAILFDSTLAAYLMMGNLSPDLKSHAVTLFEVGKLCDESIDSLLVELDKVAVEARELEGEARRHLAAALCVRRALRRLAPARPADLLRCEALRALGAASTRRLLQAKYRAALSLAPLSRGAGAGSLVAGALPLAGAAPPEATSAWGRLYLYHRGGYGPPTLLLTAGSHLRCIPRLLLGFSKLLVLSWSSDLAHEAAPPALPPAAALIAANAALKRGPVMLQAMGVRQTATLRHVMFPPECDDCAESRALWSSHGGLRRVRARLLQGGGGGGGWAGAGYVTLADIGVPDLGCAHPPSEPQLLPPKKRKDVCGIAKPISEISLSSNESSDKYNEEFTKSITNRLQSPNESHFAVTPTTDTKNSSPANGFTDLESGQLMCDELDNLTSKILRNNENIAPIHSTSSDNLKTKHSKDNCRSKESIADSDDLVKIDSLPSFSDAPKSQLDDLLSPADESISMFSKLSDKLSEMATEDSGVDTGLNVSDEETCKPEKWTILDIQFGIPLFDEELCDKISKYLADMIVKPETLEKLKASNEFICADMLKFVSQCQYYPGEEMGIVKRGSLIPLPRKNIAFENGRISEWAGK